MATLKDCINLIQERLAEKLDKRGGAIQGNLNVNGWCSVDGKMWMNGDAAVINEFSVNGTSWLNGDTNLGNLTKYKGNEIGIKAHDFIAISSVNVTTESTDTPDFWRKQPRGCYWYNQLNCLKTQPNQYGYLIHWTGSGGEVFQMFIDVPSGRMYTRGANSNGWNGNGTCIWFKASNE